LERTEEVAARFVQKLGKKSGEVSSKAKGQ
jgi:hypothetical protein